MIWPGQTVASTLGTIRVLARMFTLTVMGRPGQPLREGVTVYC